MNVLERYMNEQKIVGAMRSLDHVLFRKGKGGKWTVCGRGSYDTAYALIGLFNDGRATWNDFALEIDVGQDQPSEILKSWYGLILKG